MITLNKAPHSALVAWYRFLGDAHDWSGKANHGTVVDAVATPWGYSFNGTSAYIDLGSPLASPNAWTYLVEFTPTDVAQSSDDGILGQTNNPRITMGGIGQNRLLSLVVVSDAPGYKTVNSLNDMALNQVHTGALVVDDFSKTMTLYGDGFYIGENSWTGTLSKPGSVHYLNYRDGNKFFRGYISWAAIYNQALTQREIREEIRRFKSSLKLAA